jgi:hypothetical protein
MTVQEPFAPVSHMARVGNISTASPLKVDFDSSILLNKMLQRPGNLVVNACEFSKAYFS